MLELAILLPSSLRSLRPSCACSFICILRQSVTKMCATLSVSIVLKLAFWVTKQLHPPQIAECYYCSKKCAALSVSNELMLISGKAIGVIGLPQFVEC